MTVEQFLDSGIDLSWNDAIILEYEKFPHQYLVVEIPEYLNGFPDDIVGQCREKFERFLDYTLETLTVEDYNGLKALSLSLF